MDLCVQLAFENINGQDDSTLCGIGHVAVKEDLDAKALPELEPHA